MTRIHFCNPNPNVNTARIKASTNNPQPEIGMQQFLTLPGRLLLLGCIVGTVALFVGYVEYTLPDFPSGRYPIFLWLVPTLCAGAAAFGIAAWILERVGVKVFRRKS